MPTGYTAKLCEKDVPFAEFVMTCARAMGACILMRDEPLDAPIPESFEESDYHTSALKEAQEKLDALLAMGDGLVAMNYGSEQKSADIKRFEESLEKSRAQDARLKAMLERVKAWTPPTKDHKGLQNFMEEQLTISMDGDSYYVRALEEARAKSAMDYYHEAVKSARWNVEYHTKTMVEDAEWNKGRTDWIKQLRASLA